MPQTFSVDARPKMPSGLKTISTIKIKNTKDWDQFDPSPCAPPSLML